MGNAYCYAEQEEMNEIQEDVRQNIRLFAEASGIGGQISLSISSECPTCRDYFNQLNMNSLKFFGPTLLSHLEEWSTQLDFTEQLAFPCSDKIINYTSSYFQFALSQQNKGHIGKQLIRQLNKYFPETIECKEREILFCLKEQIYEIFACHNFEQQRFKYHRKFSRDKSIVSLAAQKFCEVAHICQSFKHIILSNFKKNEYMEQIKLYVQLYNKYQKIINNIYTKNQYVDLIEDMYNKVFQRDSDEQENKKNFYGYCMRCWCQILLTEEIRDELLASIRNIDLLIDPFLIYQYIKSVIDVSSNEYSINWLGHSKKMSLNKKLIDLNVNLIKKLSFEIDKFTSQEFYEKIDNTLNLLRQTCPQWFYEIQYENFGRELKIQKLIYEISAQKKIPRKPILEDSANGSASLSTNFDQVLKQSFQIADESIEKENLKQQSSKIAALYIQQLLSLESTTDFIQDSNIQLSSSLSISQSALKISNEIDNSKLFQFHSELKAVRMNIEIRDFILEQRTSSSLPNEGDFDFFRACDLTKQQFVTKEEERCARDIQNELETLRDLLKNIAKSERLYQN